MPAPRMRSKASAPSAPTGTTSSGGHTCQPSMASSVASMKARASSAPSEATTVPTPGCCPAVTSPADDTARVGFVLLQPGLVERHRAVAVGEPGREAGAAAELERIRERGRDLQLYR